jgi:hypothetical protein
MAVSIGGNTQRYVLLKIEMEDLIPAYPCHILTISNLVE